jgi:hypothetical protein
MPLRSPLTPALNHPQGSLTKMLQTLAALRPQIPSAVHQIVMIEKYARRASRHSNVDVTCDGAAFRELLEKAPFRSLN